MDESSFTTLYASKQGQIKKYAAGRSLGSVPGMMQSEVEVEMAWALWKAHRTYDPSRGTAFDTHWFRVWHTHRLNLVEAFFAKKRQMLVAAGLTEDDLSMLAQELSIPLPFLDAEAFPIPDCPDADPVVARVWDLLARGYLFKEVQQQVGIGRKRFDAIVAALRTNPDVLVALGH